MEELIPSPAVTQDIRKRAIPVALYSIMTEALIDHLPTVADRERYLRDLRRRASERAAASWADEKRYVVDEVEEFFEDIFTMAKKIR